MVKLARNEQCITLYPLIARYSVGPFPAHVIFRPSQSQCITLYPLIARYSVGPFPAHVIFRPSQSPFTLGLISSMRLLTARYCHFLIMGQIQPVVTVGPFVAR